MKPVILSFTLVLIIRSFSGQAVLDWVNKFDAAHNFLSEIAYDIISDEDNNIYITGFFDDSIDFDPGVGEEIYTFGEDQTSAFIAKYSSSGEFIWVIPIGSNSGQAQGSSINFDEDGNIICTGWVYQTVDFDPSPTMHNVSATGGAISLYVAKYDSDGNYIFAFAVGGNYSTEGKSILSDADNNILVIGNFCNAVDFDPSPATTILTANNFTGDLFFAKYTEDGNFIFAKQINATPTFENFDHGDFVESDEEGNIYLASMFSEQLDADPGPGITELTSVSYRNVFFAKYTADMELIWAKKLVGEEESLIQCHALTLDDDNNIYLAGWYREIIDMDPTEGEYFLETTVENASDDIYYGKYSENGDLIWAKTIGGDGYDYARCIKVRSDGLIYISGDFYKKVDFDPGTGVAFLEDTEDAEDGFICVYDNNGNYLNASQIKGNLFNETYIYNMELDNNNDIYITGCFSQTADFDCTDEESFLETYGGYDIFLAKYDTVIYTPNVAVLDVDKETINIFPNPASHVLHLNSSNPDFSISELQIFTVDGKCLLQSSGVSELNISSLPAGLYFIRILDAFYQFEKI